jgi:methyl-accepting chemotaxis protein
VKRSENGVQIAGRVGAALEQINSATNKVNTLLSEIASASGEQATGIGQVNQGVAQLDQVTQQNAGNSEELASSAEELSSQVASLNDLVAQFKVSELEATRSAHAPSARTSTRSSAKSTRDQVAPAMSAAHAPTRLQRQQPVSHDNQEVLASF